MQKKNKAFDANSKCLEQCDDIFIDDKRRKEKKNEIRSSDFWSQVETKILVQQFFSMLLLHHTESFSFFFFCFCTNLLRFAIVANVSIKTY